jgi:predicted Zn-dependent protease with MMP-like domain
VVVMDMTDEAFESAVHDALASLPERFLKALDNIIITVAQEANEQQRSKHGTVTDAGSELLGLYQGIPLPRRSWGYAGALPDVITIFKGPHLRVCSTSEQLVSQIRRTVLHEIGHYFGFDDAYLHAHGY